MASMQISRHLCFLLLLALALPGCSEDDLPPNRPDGPLADAPSMGPDIGAEAAAGDGARTDGVGADGATAARLCMPLSKPTGTVITVKPGQSKQLPAMIRKAAAGTTFMLEDGTYTFSGGYDDRGLFFWKPDVTLRSASGVRSKVIIDREYKSGELVYVGASGVTIADLTIKGSRYHAIHVVGNKGHITNTRLHNLHILDSRQQLVKINPSTSKYYADKGSLDCSVLELTSEGRKKVDQVSATGCYTGGIDGHAAWGWKVRQNTFKGLFCNNGKLAEHAVHFWSCSRDTLVERNVIIDCARGIGFGMKTSGTMRKYPDSPYPKVTGYMGHIDGVIRNNVIHGTYLSAKSYDTGIEISQNPGVKVLHNTVVTKPKYSSLDYRWSNTNAEIRNNLLYRITKRNGARGAVDHNLIKAPASLFVSLSNINYRLKSTAAAAIDKGHSLGAAGGLDLDGKAHDKGSPDLGAYEYRP